VRPILGVPVEVITGTEKAALDIATATVGLSRATEVIGVAGTVTTITAHALGLNSSAPEAIRGSRLPLADMLDSCKALSGMPRAERATDRRARRILRSKLGRVRTPARTR
jgi:exopolyphosphatase/guanosine-5'-triphosphate,3'-diphosphate pyrophosphatase